MTSVFSLDVQNTIEDAVYSSYLKKDQHDLSPLSLPELPRESELKRFLDGKIISVASVLESPLGMHFYNKYLASFVSISTVAEFLTKSFQILECSLLEYKSKIPINVLATKPQEQLGQVAKLAHSLPSTFKEYVLKLDELETVANNKSEMDVELPEGSEHDQSTMMVEVDLQETETEGGETMFEPNINQDLQLLLQELLQSCYEKCDEYFMSFKTSEEYKRMTQAMWYAERIPTVDDFAPLRVLGSGAFGEVYSAQHKVTAQLMAVKKLSKKHIKLKNLKKMIENEISVLQELGNHKSDFTVYLKFSFQDDAYIFMCLPLCTGGDLGFHLNQQGAFSLKRSIFYAAEILLGLEHLHKLRIIYRDLKPENVLLDAEGHCRISDMGLAVILPKNVRRTKQRVGTSGYWPPEFLNQEFYEFKADVWTFGVVFLEFLLGTCPFGRNITGLDRDEATLRWKIQYPKTILNGSRYDKELEPIDLPEYVIQFLKATIERDVAKRQRLNRLKKFEIFKDIDWEKLQRREIPAPYIPKRGEILAPSQNAIILPEHKTLKQVVLTEEDEFECDFIAKRTYEEDLVKAIDGREAKALEKKKEKMRIDARAVFNGKKNSAGKETSKFSGGSLFESMFSVPKVEFIERPETRRGTRDGSTIVQPQGGECIHCQCSIQ